MTKHVTPDEHNSGKKEACLYEVAGGPERCTLFIDHKGPCEIYKCDKTYKLRWRPNASFSIMERIDGELIVMAAGQLSKRGEFTITLTPSQFLRLQSPDPFVSNFERLTSDEIEGGLCGPPDDKGFRRVIE